MKENYRRLGCLLRVFGADNFYASSVFPSSVTAQGKFNPSVMKHAIKLGFNQSMCNVNGYIELTRGNYTITLTD